MNEPRSPREPVPHIVLPLEADFPLKAVLTLRAAGDMNIRQQPNPVVKAVAGGFFPGKTLTVLRQEHTRRVLVASTGQDVGFQEGDGLLTANPALVLGVTVADCLPIVLADAGTRAWGLLHSGWKGTGILEEALSQFQRSFGTRPEDLSVAFGPCIGPCCYRVPEERARDFQARYGEAVAERRGADWHLDLVEANRVMLARNGVDRYTALRECTACSERLGSYRREGAQGFTRMLVLAGCDE